MRKKQKISKKKKSQKVYKDFIYIVKWWKYDFILASHISNIYDDNDIGIGIFLKGKNHKKEEKVGKMGKMGKNGEKWEKNGKNGKK